MLRVDLTVHDVVVSTEGGKSALLSETGEEAEYVDAHLGGDARAVRGDMDLEMALGGAIGQEGLGSCGWGRESMGVEIRYVEVGGRRGVCIGSEGGVCD
jgi:hypothetical protein